MRKRAMANILSRRLFLVSTAAAAASIAPQILRASSGSDIAILRRAYTQLHPGLYRYSTPEETAVRFDMLERDFAAASTSADRYIVLSRFLATIRCGHTYANFFNQTKAVQETLFFGTDKLPFHFVWLGAQLVITRDFSGLQLRPGTEILSVEGRPSSKVLAGLLAVARADGHNDAKRRSLMSVKGTDSIESFDVFYPLIFGARERYRLTVKLPDGSIRVASAPAIDIGARRAENPALSAKTDDAPIWTFETRRGAAILTMPDWSLYNSKWDWKSWLDGRFEEMQTSSLTGLVVDIRSNEGGLDCGDEIIARLIDAPVQRTLMQRRVRYRRVPDDLVPYLDTWDPSFRDWGNDAQPFDNRFYALSNKDDSGTDQNIITPKGPRFKGKVAVLIGSENSSATFQFAQLVRNAKLGVLVGEDTGGNLRGINGGAFFFLRLPQSGLEADLPLIGTFPPVPQSDSGLSPDVAVSQSVESIASSRDLAMERALTLVS